MFVVAGKYLLQSMGGIETVVMPLRGAPNDDVPAGTLGSTAAVLLPERSWPALLFR